jgi:hypothetical protein
MQALPRFETVQSMNALLMNAGLGMSSGGTHITVCLLIICLC